MNRLKKGPELKMPDLKVPDFLKDLFYDLHDRRLLAPLALVLVAIVAVPFVLAGGSEDSAPVTGAVTSPGEPEAATSARFTVVEAQPGLRDYRKRLAARKPTDPFKQRYTSPKVEGAGLSQGTDESSSEAGTVTTSSSSGTTTVSSPPSYTPPPSTSLPSTSPPAGGGDGKPHLTFFTWGIDVRISKSDGSNRASSDESQEPLVKDRVLPQTALPGPKLPVVTYMGLSRKAAQKKTEKVLLLVSSDVKEISGSRTCASAQPTGICELIEVKPGSPVTFVYGENEVRYTIKVLKLELVVTGHA